MLSFEILSGISPQFCILVIFVLILFKLLKNQFQGEKNAFNSSLRKTSIPKVSLSLPLIGHGIQICFGFSKFLKTCYERYGDIFEIDVFRRPVVVLCTSQLAGELFKKGETQASMFQNLDDGFMREGVVESRKDFKRHGNAIKKTLGGNAVKLTSDIVAEADNLVYRIRNKMHAVGQVDIYDDVLRYLMNLGSQCLFGYKMNDNVFKFSKEFANLMQLILYLSFLLPHFIIKIVFKWRLLQLRTLMTKELNDFVANFMENPALHPSPFFQNFLSSLSQESRGVSSSDIGDAFAHAVFVSSVNTKVFIRNALIELASHPTCMQKFRALSNIYQENEDYEGLLSDNYINACIMESARVCAIPITVLRAPKDGLTIGGHVVDAANVSAVVICGTLLQNENSRCCAYQNPMEFNPERFTNGEEPMGPPFLTAWGGGVHPCPGKAFAINQIKIAVAKILTNFEIRAIPKGKIASYFAPNSNSRKAFDLFVGPQKQTY